MDDKEIVELYLKRDESAIALTESKYGEKLKRLAFSIVNDRETAEECVNDAYYKAWNSIPPNEPGSYLLPYLLRIVRQLALNRLKKSKTLKRRAIMTELTREMDECLPSDSNVSDPVETKELIGEINSFLAGLSREKRDVFILRYWFMLNVTEIAKRMGIGESKVKTMLFRLRSELKAYLIDKGYSI